MACYSADSLPGWLGSCQAGILWGSPLVLGWAAAEVLLWGPPLVLGWAAVVLLGAPLGRLSAASSFAGRLLSAGLVSGLSLAGDRLLLVFS